MANKDLPIAVIMMIIFIILFGLSFTFQSSGVLTTHTTAAFFPRVVLIVAMFLDLVLIIKSIKHGSDDDIQEERNREAGKRVGLSMGWAILFGFGVSYLGTLVSMVLFIAGIMLIWGVRNTRIIALSATISPIFVYLIFKKLLLVQLPAGILM